MKLSPLHTHFAVEITDLCLLSPMSSQQQQELKQALLDYKVLIFRDHELTPQQYIRFCSKLGNIWTTQDEMQAEAKFQFENYPEIVRVSNHWGVLGKIELLYHADGSHHPRRPYPIRCLYASSIPENAGGDTTWADMEMAYSQLPSSEKSICADLKALHRPRYFVGWEHETVFHPLVRVHPVTKRKSLSVDEYFTVGIQDWPEDRARIFLKGLLQKAIQNNNTYTHKWKNNDLVIFDNNNTVHARTEIHGPNERLLWRITMDFQS